MIKDATAVGWHGIVLQAPRDWSLVAVSGDEKKGYFRIDSPRAAAVELRWIQTKKTPNIEERAQEILRQLERASKKRRVQFSSKIKSRKPTQTELETGGSSIAYTWRGDNNGYGRLLYCGTCRRVVIAQVVSPVENDLSGLAGEILGTVCDHRDPSRRVWGLYDLQATLPTGYRLVKHTLMSGYIMLSFRSQDGELVVERWGLANTLLKKSDIEEWFKKDSLPDYREFKLNIEPSEDEEGHLGLRLTGRRVGIRQTVRRVLRSLTLRPLPQELAGYVWHCPESNRLFAVRVVRTEADELAREIKDGVVCH